MHAVGVTKEPGIPGGWKTKDVILRATDPDATLEFRGRIFVIENFAAFHGVIHPDQVSLRGNEFEVRITAEMFEVGYPDLPPQRWRLADMPEGKKAIFDGQTMRFE